MLMDGEKFKHAVTGSQQSSPRRARLPRDLTTMLISGPAGATDPVLWTLLLRERSQQSVAERKRDQPRARPERTGLRAFFAVALRAAFARGP
jgi:hypothetical protein